MVRVKMGKSKFTDAANEIVPKLRDQENAVVVEDPFWSLKSTLFSFFENMLKKVQAEDAFMTKVKDAIVEKIDTGDITIAQLMVLLDSLNRDKQILVDTMLSIFKPAPGTGEVSPLINPKVTNSEGGTPFANLSAGERSVLDKLSRIVEEAEESTKEN